MSIEQRVVGRAGQLLEAVEDRRQEEPGQEQHAEEVLDVAEEDVGRREEPGEPEREAEEAARIGIASSITIERDSGTTNRSIGTSTANMTSEHETAWASTTAIGTISRGNQTFLMICALRDELRWCPPERAAWKKTHTVRPVSTKSG